MRTLLEIIDTTNEVDTITILLDKIKIHYI